MKYPRITIAELMLVVLVAGLGLGAMRSASPAWAGAMWSITIFAMICSLLGIALRRGSRQAYWIGFATLGWSYLLLIFVPWLHENIGSYLLAPNLFAYLEEVLRVDIQPGGGMQSLPLQMLGAIATAGGFTPGALFDELSGFVRIGMAMEALLWAFLGGRVAYYFASGRDQESNHRVTSSAGTIEADARAQSA
jgi:hypothetical protein